VSFGMRWLRLQDSSLSIVVTGSDIPAYIERSKIGEFPLGYAWGRE
jgi:hypothetical protein